jgi:GAF domain-containing protein
MSEMAQTQLTDVFVEMADTMTADFDLIEFLHTLTERCVEFLDIAAAGLLLTDGQGTLRLMAASSERSRLLELFQVQADEGPCLDCFRTGQPVSVADLAADGRWPRFTVAAGEAGFAAVHAIPMRLRAEVIGALNFFDTDPGPVDPGKLRIGQALADVATIGLIQQRVIRDRDVLTEQLRTALNSRVLIEQAKGVLAERLGLDMADAFTLLRSTARSRNRNLSDLAHALVEGTEQITVPVKAAPGHPAPPPPRSRR